MSDHFLADLGWKIQNKLMRWPQAQQWLVDQCNKHLEARWEEGWRPSVFSPDGSVASYLTLVEKAAAVVAIRDIACPGEEQNGPIQFPDYLKDHESREWGVRWGHVVSATNEGLRPEHRIHVENWLKDVEAALREAGIEFGPDTVAPAETAGDATGHSSIARLLKVFTNGVSDERIKQASQLLDDQKLTVNEKLTKIDALIRFPATSSAEKLGEMLCVTKQAILKTDWWIENRKGEKENAIGRRHAVHQKRASEYETPDARDDD
jgi:hypothetical protein